MRAFKWTILAATLSVPMILSAATATVLGWNNLGMHCMDSDYSVFSILPPYNTIESQLIVNGLLVTNGAGYTVTYQAVADPSSSFNSTAIGKGNYYTYIQPLFGAALAPDQGLAGWNMPGTNNTPQAMLFEQTNQPAAGVLTPVNWWRAEGIPLSPYDDAHNKNPYPMMRLIAKNGATPIATNDIVLPVSDEMDCRACHASGTQSAAKPAAGWVWDGIQERDFRLNILRLHDEKQFASNAVLYAAALAARGFNPQGLYRGVVADNKPVLCAACHASEALGAPSYGTIPPLTASIHSFHAHVLDPISSLTLDSSGNRSACYRCHPGSTTKCLRGAMGGAIAADGSMEMQCQSCHGNMSTVGSATRVGWFMEPNCASCHTGTATSNNGQIRYTSVFTDTNGTVRVPVNQTFATQSNTPAGGLSLFRFSGGHGGLQCEACHGSTHAEFPSTHANDNVRDIKLQGHAGVMVECTSCHVSMSVSSSTATNGPHGMHPIGQSWVSGHHDYINGNLGKCQACHGTDNRGTVLSRVQGNRTLTASFDGGTVTLNLFRGALIGCYTCHSGPSDDNINNSAPPTVNVVSGSTANNTALNLPVTVTPITATLRIISQPANGSLGVSNNLLTYFPNAGFAGSDTFTYAAWDGSKNSVLATGTVSVVQGPYSLGIVSHVATNAPSGWPVAFTTFPTVTNNSSAVIFSWNFGDGSAPNTNQFAQHIFTAPGIYSWQVMATVGASNATNSGKISVKAPVALAMTASRYFSLSLAWPSTLPDVVIEQSTTLGSTAQWTVVTNLPMAGPANSSVSLPVAGDNRFFRLRQPW
ncbi:MAG: PKD domain-containing protein [Formivibrio sp.]|nr:PKD domain-containing protein [Formivibrio sp.]